MVVEPRKKEGSSSPQSRKPLFISLGLHLVVFLLVIFGLPHWRTEPDIVEPVPVELVANVGELTTTNKPPVETPKPEKPKEEPPKKEKEPPKPPEPKKSTPPPPDEETLKDPPKPDKPEKVDDTSDKKIEKKPEKKKEPPKKEPEKQNDFDSLLKDLTPEEKQQPDTDETDKKMTEPSPQPNISKFSDVLSISEMDALRQQLSQCWSVMAGAENSEDLRVEMEVEVNEDRTVRSAKIVDQSRYNDNPYFRAAADSAMRAMRNPNCTPLNVPPEKYNQWHRMVIVFDPKDMF